MGSVENDEMLQQERKIALPSNMYICGEAHVFPHDTPSNILEGVLFFEF